MKSISKIWMISLLVGVMLLAGCSQKAVRTIPADESKGGEGDEYVIGPEDVLEIQVWREQALSGKVLVRADGKISLPLIQDITAAGLTPPQLQERLTEKLKEFIDSPNVSVVVLEVNSFKIYISGQVKSPGVHRLRTKTTLLQFIPMVGGFTEWAKQKKILVIRKEKGEEKRITVDYKKMVEGKVPALVLKSGDTIIVP
jgi:polysaccharide export outer membrane protein